MKMAQFGGVGVLWIVTFVVGAFRPSKKILESMAEAGFLDFLRLVPEAILSWGWSNIALLSVLAGVAGVLGRSDEGAIPSGAARGFFVFLLAVSGQLFYSLGFSEPSLHFPDHQTYFRLATLISAAAFAAGWSPTWLGEIFTKVGKKIEQT